jgi:hypothetical protein
MHGSEVGLLLMKPMEKLTYITVTIDYMKITHTKGFLPTKTNPKNTRLL